MIIGHPQTSLAYIVDSKPYTIFSAEFGFERSQWIGVLMCFGFGIMINKL
jgi:hypothetical protein